MIKQLIKDIAFDNIKLSQALTRAKLVANKINNESFKQWLTKELEGYKFNDEVLPTYRKALCPIFLKAELPFGRIETFPVSFPESFGEQILDLVNYHRIIEPISIVEQQIENVGVAIGQVGLSVQQVEILSTYYNNQVQQYGGVIRSGYREIGRIQYQNVLELTKQKLLETLMQLENEFPNLIDDYIMNEENSEKVQNIITNNIYGNNNPTNIASGYNVEQNISYSQLTSEDEAKLESFGLLKSEIEELKHIIETNKKDKPNLVSKAMKWLGSVTASVAGRGLYENLPQIAEFVEKIIR